MKQFIAFLAIASCFGGISTGWAARPWKTLKDKYGFSVNYPSDWEVVDPEGDTNPAMLPFFRIEGPTAEKKKNREWVQIELGCYSRKRSGPETTSKDSALRSIDTPPVRILSQRDVILGNEPAYEITGFDSRFVDPRAIVDRGGVYRYRTAWHKHRLCEVTYAEMGTNTKKMTSDSEWKYRDLMDSIIRSFRFLR